MHLQQKAYDQAPSHAHADYKLLTNPNISISVSIAFDCDVTAVGE